MSHFCVQWSELNSWTLSWAADFSGASSRSKHLQAVSPLSTFIDTSQLTASSAITVATRFRFLLRQVALLDNTSFQIWSRWLIGWSGSTESADLSVTKQWNTLAESRSRVTALSRSISCRDSCFAPANVVGWESRWFLLAIFCSMIFNCSLFDFKSEMHGLSAVCNACNRNKFIILANDNIFEIKTTKHDCPLNN